MSTPSFTSDDLYLAASNDADVYKLFRSYTKLLRVIVDGHAEKCAKANADWHDDPESDDHEMFHAPAEHQYPRLVRDRTLIRLVRYHLEIFIQEDGASC